MDGFDIVAACGYISREFIQICPIYTHPLKLLAAFGGHEESLRSHLALYIAIVPGNVDTLLAWQTAPVRELSRIRGSALRRITGRAETLRRKTGEELKRDFVKAKRAQSRFAKELRKLERVK